MQVIFGPAGNVWFIEDFMRGEGDELEGRGMKQKTSPFQLQFKFFKTWGCCVFFSGFTSESEYEHDQEW